MQRVLNRRAWLVLVSARFFGCGSPEDESSSARDRGPHANELRAEDIRRAAEASGLPPEEAALRLQEFDLLAARAERLGFGRDPRVRRVGAQSSVQGLLAREVEARVQAEQVSPAELRAAMDARTFEAVEPVLARWRDQPVGDASVRVERIPDRVRDGGLARPFEDALFEGTPGSVVPHAVRTSFGWHAIVVGPEQRQGDSIFRSGAHILWPLAADATHAETVSAQAAMERATAELAAALERFRSEKHEEILAGVVNERRREALERLLESLRAKTAVTIEAEALRGAEQIRIEEP